MQLQRPYIIGITGGSGSGKTFILKKLEDEFFPGQLSIVAQDHYYHPREVQPIDPKGIINFDLPDSIDHHSLLDDVRTLVDGKSVLKKEYTFNNKEKEPTLLKFNPAPVLIVEGLFVHWFEELNKLLDLKVFIEADEKIRLNRRLDRDARERGYPAADVYYRFEHHIEPAFKKYIEPFKATSDLVIQNNTTPDAGMQVLTGIIARKLGG